MPRNKTQKCKKTVGGTLTGRHDRGSPFDDYFRDFFGNNQNYNDFVDELKKSENNYTTGSVMKRFKNNEGHKVLAELRAEKAKQKPPSPKTKKVSPKPPSPKPPSPKPPSPKNKETESPKTKKVSPKNKETESSKQINAKCISEGIEPMECREKKDLKHQRFIFHPDKNSNCAKDAEEKFKRLISKDFPKCQEFDSQ